MKKAKNKWLIVAAAIGIHLSIGSVYAWSVLARPIMARLGCTLQEVTWIFSIAILFLGLSAGSLGSFVEHLGPKKSGLIATALFTGGMLGSALALTRGSLLLLYLFYGVIGGIGLGVGYIAPVSTLVKYFPKNRGLAAGLAIMGFGFAGLIAAPVMQLLIAGVGLVQTFLIMGSVYFLLMLSSSLYLAPPPEALAAAAAPQHYASLLKDNSFTPAQAVSTWQFKILWWLFFTNITCGIALLAVASPMAQELVGLSPLAAASMVGIVGLLNGLGRLVWSAVSDRIGRPFTYIAFFALQIAAFLLLARTKDALLFQGLIYLIITCYGGGFACMPAYLSDLFGSGYLSAIHGRILTAWGLAGIAGPLLLSLLYERSKSYAVTLSFFAAALAFSLLLALLLKQKGEPQRPAA